MLQQTTVTTVVPYWERFMASFPDVASLAKADMEDVLRMWSGLGYYRRARQLHEAARILMTQENGQLPGDREGWLQLPGIGPYASGAIASIGLHQRVPALDANARRVLTRWLIETPDFLADLHPAHLEIVGTELVDPDRPGDWNEAVMELGALICRASNPLCGDCPVRDLCRAGRAGQADLIPPPKRAVANQRVQLGVLVLVWGDRILLMPPGGQPAVVPAGSPAPVRKDVSGLHKGLWGLPSTPWLPDPGDPKTVWPGRVWRPWLKEISGPGFPAEKGDPVLLGKFRHAVTRYRLLVQVYGLRLPGSPPAQGSPLPGKPNSILISGAAESLTGAEGTLFQARFCRWVDPEQPVSNLVKKSLLVAESRQV
jgi:A/G-specific adenine glycosylase